MSSDFDKWSSNNSKYWDEIAPGYDELYNDRWSNFENQYVSGLLRELLFDNCNVLDLGCGTGLGYAICSEINSSIQYVGVDSSIGMLNIFSLNFPKAKIIHSSMSDLKEIREKSIDLVISTFTAFSYTDNINLTLNEIKRVLKPKGSVLLSVLGKRSLRRLTKLQFSKQELYNTRSSFSSNHSHAWTFSVNEVRELFSEYDFKHVKVYGYNAFGGIDFLEKPLLWRISKLIASGVPNLSHELIIKARI